MGNLSGFVKRLRDIMRNDAGINGDAQRIEQIAWLLFLKVYDAKEQDWEWTDEDYQSIIPEDCRWSCWAHDDKSGTATTGEKLLDFVNNTLFPTLKRLPVDPSTPIKKAIVQTTFADANNYMKDGVLLRQVINIIDELDLSDYEESHAFGEIYESILKELQSAGSAGEFYTPRAVTDFMAMMINPHIGERMADFACGTGGFITSWLKELKKQVHTTEDETAYSNSIYGIEKKQFPYMLCITNMLLHDLDVPQVYHDNSLLRDVLDYTEDDQFEVILMNPPYGGSEKADVKNHFPADLASSETADLFMSVIMYRLKENGRAAVILPDGFLFGTDNAKVNIKKKLLSEFNLHTVIRMPGSVFSPYTSITTNILFFERTGPTKETWFYRLDMPEGYKHFSKTKPMNGYSPKGVDYPTNVRNLTLTATTSGKFNPNAFKYVDVQIDPRSKYWLRHNDLLIQRSNSRELVGTSCIYNGDDNAYIYPDLMMRLRTIPCVNVFYLDYVLKSPMTRAYFMCNAVGTSESMPKINQNVVANTLIPLPPVAEQKRIVAKLEELLPLCERLK